MTTAFTTRAGIIGVVLTSSALLAVGVWFATRSALSTPSREHAEVVVRWPGAATKEVESSVTIPLEQALMKTPGLHRVRSTSRAERSRVELQFDRAGLDGTQTLYAALREAQARLPASAEPPMFSLRPRDVHDERYVVRSETMPMGELSEWVKRDVRRALEVQPGVRSVEFCGARDARVIISLDSAQLAAFGLQPVEIASRLRVRTFTDLEALNTATLSGVALRDVATLERNPARTDCDAEFDGAQVIAVTVSRSGTNALTLPPTPAGVSVTALKWKQQLELSLQDGADPRSPKGLVLMRARRTQVFAEKPVAVPEGFTLLQAADGVVVRVRGAEREALEVVAKQLHDAVAKSAPQWLGAVQPTELRAERTVKAEARQREVAEAMRLYFANGDVGSLADGTRLELRVDQSFDAAHLADGTPLSSIASIEETLEPDALLREDGLPTLEFFVGAPERDVQRALATVALPMGVSVVVSARVGE